MKVQLLLILTFCLFFADSVFAMTPREVAEKSMEGYNLFIRDSVPDDRAKGYAMMLEAAWEGDAKAANNVGWLMEQGEFVDKDLQGALRWYERAADQSLPAAALNYVNLIFHHPEAIGAKGVDIERLAKAAMTAGTALAMGRGLHYDYRSGEDLIMRAAILGNRDAAMTIAQQLEMYPDSFSYLPFDKIVEECNALLPPDKRIKKCGLSSTELTDLLLTPQFWYARTQSSLP